MLQKLQRNAINQIEMRLKGEPIIWPPTGLKNKSGWTNHSNYLVTPDRRVFIES